MANPTYDGSRAEWRRLLKPRTNKSGEIPHLEGHWAKLESVLTQADEIEGQQAALAANKQELSQKLKALILEGRKIAAFLKAGLREHFGKSAERLAEYGLQPFRGFKKAKPEEPVEVKPPTSTPTTTPTD